MRVLVLGGSGVFGGRLARLSADGERLELLIGGRDLARAARLCAAFGAPAREAGVSVPSGGWSFPVPTAAVLRALARAMTLRRVEGGIAPSPLAGVGGNVPRAVLGHAGAPVAPRRDGREATGGSASPNRGAGPWRRPARCRCGRRASASWRCRTCARFPPRRRRGRRSGWAPRRSPRRCAASCRSSRSPPRASTGAAWACRRRGGATGVPSGGAGPCRPRATTARRSRPWRSKRCGGTRSTDARPRPARGRARMRWTSPTTSACSRGAASSPPGGRSGAARSACGSWTTPFQG